MFLAVYEAERVAEPLALRVGEYCQRRGEVEFVCAPQCLGLVQQLHVRGEVRNAVSGSNPRLAIGRRMRWSRRDTQSLPEDSSSMTWIRHGWPGPGRHQMSCTLIGSRSAGSQGRRLPGGSAAWPLPVRQCPQDRKLVRPQQQHVDVAVFAHRPSDRELDGVTTGDPPPGGASGKDLRNL